jgi:hypothetical protein
MSLFETPTTTNSNAFNGSALSQGFSTNAPWSIVLASACNRRRRSFGTTNTPSTTSAPLRQPPPSPASSYGSFPTAGIIRPCSGASCHRTGYRASNERRRVSSRFPWRPAATWWTDPARPARSPGSPSDRRCRFATLGTRAQPPSPPTTSLQSSRSSTSAAAERCLRVIKTSSHGARSSLGRSPQDPHRHAERATALPVGSRRRTRPRSRQRRRPSALPRVPRRTSGSRPHPRHEAGLSGPPRLRLVELWISACDRGHPPPAPRPPASRRPSTRSSAPAPRSKPRSAARTGSPSRGR